MNAHKQKYDDLRGDGRIVLFLREGNVPKYSVRLKVPGTSNYKVLSTKTADRNEAVRRAMDLYDELYHQVRTTGSIHSNTYADVFERWKQSRLNSYGEALKKDRTVEYAGTYSLDFFAKMRINQITPKDFHKYWDWRKLGVQSRHLVDWV